MQSENTLMTGQMLLLRTNQCGQLEQEKLLLQRLRKILTRKLENGLGKMFQKKRSSQLELFMEVQQMLRTLLI